MVNRPTGPQGPRRDPARDPDSPIGNRAEDDRRRDPLSMERPSSTPTAAPTTAEPRTAEPTVSDFELSDRIREFERQRLEALGDTFSEEFNEIGGRFKGRSIQSTERVIDLSRQLERMKNAGIQKSLVDNTPGIFERIGLSPGTFTIEELEEAGGVLAAVRQQREARGQPPEFLSDSEYQDLTEQLREAETEADKNDFLLDYYRLLPALWHSGQVTSFEQSLQRISADLFNTQGPVRQGQNRANVAILNNLSDSERDELRQVFEEVSEKVVQIPAGSLEESRLDEIRDQLQRKPNVNIVGLASLTTQQIIRNFSTPARPESIEGLSNEQLRAIMSEAGVSEELLQSINSAAQQYQEFANDATEQRLARQALLLSFTHPELPELSTWESVKLAAARPAFVTVESMEHFFNNTTRPWASFLVSSGTLPVVTTATGVAVGLGVGGPVGGVVGGAAGLGLGGSLTFLYQGELSRLYDEARRDGESFWQAHSRAFQEWDENEGIKMLVETAADFTIPFGTGVFSKALPRAGKLGILGRTLGVYEQNFIDYTNEAFRILWPQRTGFLPLAAGGLSAGLTIAAGGGPILAVVAGVGGLAVTAHAYTLIPKTIEQVVSDGGAKFQAALYSGAQRLAETQTGGVIVGAPPVTSLRQYLQQAARAHVADPDMAFGSEIAGFGRQMWQAGYEYQDANSFRPLLEQIYQAESLPRAVRALNDPANLQQINELLYHQRGNSRLLTTEELATQLSTFIKGDNVSEAANLRYIEAWLHQFRRSVYQKSIDIAESSNNPRKVMTDLGNLMRDTMRKNLTSETSRFVGMQGKTTALFSHVDKLAHLTGLNFIERRIVYPISRHVLLFLSYGPMNILESGIRMAFAGMFPWVPRGVDVIAGVNLKFGRFRNFPVSFRQMGLDDGFRVLNPMMAVPASAQEARTGVTRQVSGPIPLINKPISEFFGAIPGPMGRKLQSITSKLPDSVQSLAGFNDMFTKWSNLMQARYLDVQITKEMKRIDPQAFDQMASAVAGPRGGLSSNPTLSRSLDKKTLTALENAALDRGFIGPTAIRGMKSSKEVITNKNMIIKLENWFQHHPELDSYFRDTVMQMIHDGRLRASNIEETVPALYAAWLDTAVMGRAELAHIQLREVFNQIKSVQPRNTEELLRVLNQVQQTVDSVGHDQGSLSSLMKTAIRRGDEVNFNERQKIWETAQSAMSSMTDEVDFNVRREIESLRNMIAGGSTQPLDLSHIQMRLTEGQQELVTRLFENEIPRSAVEGIRTVRTGDTLAFDLVEETLTIPGNATEAQIKEAAYTALLELDISRGNTANIEEIAQALGFNEEGLEQILRNYQSQNGTRDLLIVFENELLNQRESLIRALERVYPNKPGPVEVDSELQRLLNQRLDSISSKLSLLTSPNGPRAVQNRFHDRIFGSQRPAFLRLPGPQREAVYRTELNRVRQAWDKYFLDAQAIDIETKKIDARIARLSGNQPQEPQIRYPVFGKLSPADVAHLYGVQQTDDLVRNLINPETLMMTNKEQFIDRTMRDAAEAASAQGRRPEDFGFTREAVEDVYNNLMQSVSIDPAAADDFTPGLMLFDDLRHELHNVFQTSQFSDEVSRVLNQEIEEMALRLEDTGLYDPHMTIDEMQNFVDQLGPDQVGDFAGRIQVREFTPSRDMDTGTLETSRIDINSGSFETQVSTEQGQAVLEPNSAIIQLPRGQSQSFGNLAHELGHLLEDTKPNTSEAIRSIILNNRDEIENALGFTLGSIQGQSWIDEIIPEVYEEVLAGGRGRLRDTGHGLESRLIGRVTDDGQIESLTNIMEEMTRVVRQDLDIPVPEATSRWDRSLDQAVTNANLKLREDFPDYTNANAFDQAMRAIYPFWIYENQRWPWIVKHAVQQPGAFNTWARYTDASDGGYVRIPGTDLQINPTRGTVWAGGLRRLYTRDYQEYADQFGTTTEVLDFLGRFGFYPGAHFTLPTALFGAKATGAAPQTGQVLVPWMNTALGLMNSAAPNAEWTRVLSETILPDNFRDYRTMIAVNDAGGDGLEILNKIRSNVELTPEEERQWNRARNRVMLIAGVLDAQMGLFRFRPQEMEEAFNALQIGMEELTGVPVEMQEHIQDRFGTTGQRFTDVYPLDPLDRFILREVLEKYKKWLRPNIAPLLPSVQGDIAFKTTSYFNEVEDIWSSAREDGFFDEDPNTGEEFLAHKSLNQLEIEFQQGQISETEYLSSVQQTIEQAVIRSDALGDIDYYRDVPKTRNQREEFFERFDIPTPTYHPAQELYWEYFSLTPKLAPDPETGVMRPDFDRYFAQLDALLGSMHPGDRQRLLARIQADWTSTQRLHWEVNRQFIRPYRNVADVIADQYTDEQKDVIKQFRRGDTATKERLREVLLEDEQTKLISDWQAKTRQARENMRMLEPELDAWLLFWGEVTSPKTPEARQIANDLISQHRPGAERFIVEEDQ